MIQHLRHKSVSKKGMTLRAENKINVKEPDITLNMSSKPFKAYLLFFVHSSVRLEKEKPDS